MKFWKTILPALVLLGVSSAYAADLPVKAPVMSYTPAYVDAFSGTYLGIHGGYGWNLGSTSAAFAVVPLGNFSVAPQGFIGGLQAGYGQRVGQYLYLGLEGDVDIATLDGTSTLPGFVGTVTSRNTWMGSVRARVGVIPVGHAMIYGTAGYGFGSAEFRVTDFAGLTASVKPTTSGFVWGGGLEVPFSANWLGRIEYLQYDFGTLSATTLNAVTASAKDRVDVVPAGISYKF
jgi:outer membrane immunogenic protein